MKALVVSALLASVGLAHAESAATIKPPAGWHIDEAQSQALGAKLKAIGHFGLPADPGRSILANADVYVPPKPGVVLSVVLVAAKTTEREAAARAAVDELHAASQRAAITGSGVTEDGWQEKADPAAKQVEATLAWRDSTAKTSATSRLLVVADETQITSLTGECFAADDADPKLLADCIAALATLDPGIPADKRVPLALAPTGTRPTPPASSDQNQPRMDDGSRAPLPPITISQEARSTDRRPVYVGAGLVVMAVVFWWNRRRRAQREDESDER